jgi:hypothetical protein
LWRFENNTTFAPGAMDADPILSTDIRQAMFWDLGATNEADALMVARKNAANEMEYAELVLAPLEGSGNPTILGDVHITGSIIGNQTIEGTLTVEDTVFGTAASFPSGAILGPTTLSSLTEDLYITNAAGGKVILIDNNATANAQTFQVTSVDAFFAIQALNDNLTLKDTSMLVSFTAGVLYRHSQINYFFSSTEMKCTLCQIAVQGSVKQFA